MLPTNLPKLVNEARLRGASGSQILGHARDCGIEAYLMAETAGGRLKKEDLEIENIEAYIASFRAEQTARQMLWKRTAAEVLQTLAMPTIVLKGPPLGLRLAGDPIWRDSADVDVWVAPQNRDIATRRLLDAGYHIAEQPHLWATNQIMLARESRLPVEIHWALAPPPWHAPTFDEALEASVPFSFKGLTFQILCDGMLHLHLILHAHQHYFALKTAIDYALAQSQIRRDGALTRRFGLTCLERVLDRVSAPLIVQNGNASHQGCIYHLSEIWFDPILASNRGELAFGRDSKWTAALGVAIRAASMALLDGIVYPAKAFGRVLFLGPHRIGAFNQHLMAMLQPLFSGALPQTPPRG